MSATEFEIKTNTVTEEWTSRKWRPAMGWVYMAICIFDFVLFPVLWSLSQALFDGEIRNQWNPITLQGAGLFHLAMGAVLGITAYGRTKEKISGVMPSSLIPPSRYQYNSTDIDDEYDDDIRYKSTTTRIRQPFIHGATQIPKNLTHGDEE